ncbi:DoxX family protein [Marinibactrum halimedae]|uniref:HvfX family Cu-binding RiPP maturation protein n=1 Tax=Marinibactrum halimedae TaxID=1444977 RepID=UPI0024E0F371|nr:DoxX family protein [Marinibactrum halimedae]MCD9457458.1 DoxX family protein [Marinibactrum halimedae]
MLVDNIIAFYTSMIKKIQCFEGLPPLLLRLILAPVMIQAGWNKWVGWEGTVQWFGNAEWGLGLPLPEVMAFLAVGAELVGGILILLGLATRLVAIPLMVTMLVAAFAVHWENGWLAISDASSWLANERIEEAEVRKARAVEILKEHGNYDWLTARGSITILNNGIEFAITYFVMLLSLFFTGGGRYVSADYWVACFFQTQHTER